MAPADHAGCLNVELEEVVQGFPVTWVQLDSLFKRVPCLAGEGQGTQGEGGFRTAAIGATQPGPGHGVLGGLGDGFFEGVAGLPELRVHEVSPAHQFQRLGGFRQSAENGDGTGVVGLAVERQSLIVAGCCGRLEGG